MVNRCDFSKEQMKELAFTQAELEELAAARKRPIAFDEECPETTPERALKFHRANPPRGDSRYA